MNAYGASMTGTVTMTMTMIKTTTTTTTTIITVTTTTNYNTPVLDDSCCARLIAPPPAYVTGAHPTGPLHCA